MVVGLVVTVALVGASLFVGEYDIFGADDGAEMFGITRVPRTIALVLSGAAMAMCGLVMQMITQNRFVEPTTTGTTEWAGLGLILVMVVSPGADLLTRMVVAIVFSFVGTMVFFLFLRRVTLRSSLIVPIKAVLGFLLSIAASFGAVVAVYQLGWMKSLFGVDTPAPIISFLPVLLIGILFGLSMDYEMFLVSGMREAHAHGTEARRAVTTGYMAGSRVVTAAALIMISVFAGFILAPDAIIASIGFALAIGVLFDAFVVRMTIVPAVMRLLGEKAWYFPRWMDKTVPHADVEGTRLMAKLEADDERRPAEDSRQYADV